jgi:O-antigen/teichoic acid export membrane protein
VSEQGTLSAGAAPWLARPGLRLLAANVSWLVAERLFLLLANLVVNVWFINYLGSAAYGRYAYALSFTALFAALANLGLDTVVVRELCRDEGSQGQVLATAFWLRVTASWLTLGVVALTVLQVGAPPEVRGLVLIVALGLLFEPAQVIDLWFQSRILSKYAVLARSSATILTLAAKVLLIAGSMSLVAFAWLQVASVAWLGLLLGLAFVRQWPRRSLLRPSARRARELLADSWPLIVSGLSVSLYMKIDRIMIGEMLSSQDVGTYAAAAAVSEAFYFLPVVFASSLFPVVIRTREQRGAALYGQRMQALYDGMTGLGYAVAIAATLLAGPLVRGLLDPEFHEAAGVLRIHVWALVFVALGVARSRYIVAENLTRFLMLATVLGAVVNVALNLLLIPRLGITGAACSTLVSYGCSAYLAGWLVRATWSTTRQMTLALLAPLRPAAVIRGWRALL